MVATLGKPNSRTARFISAFVLALLWVIAVGPFSDASAQTSMQKRAAIRANSPFNLASGANTVLQANLVQCGLNNSGDVCTDVFDSPTGGGGYWPSGTTNQYIFNSGLQIAGINATAGLPAGWAGDTVGAYFFDARGTQKHGTPLTDVYNSLTPGDLANWPAGGMITDTALFNSALIGSTTISDQDSYVEYWDGNPDKNAGRSHPMGIKVQQRSLAFNAPAGAENTIFFIYRFTNVTNDPAFQALNEPRFNVQLPDAGWTINNIYAAFAMDPDVTTNAGVNFSTGFLPFNMGMAYQSAFVAPDFNFVARADLYAPPFFQAPGLVGVKFLRSPINPVTKQEVGLTMFSNTTNGAPFPDPVGVKQLFRYLKGDTQAAAGDPVCTIPQSVQRRLCALVQTPADTRFYQASGPFTLAAGQSATIVVAYTHGPPVKLPTYTAGTTLAPGIPSLHPGLGGVGDTIRTIERIAGLISIPNAAYQINATDTTVNQKLLVPGVNFVRRSLVANALIAQSIFDNKFLLPRPPEAPKFSLVPGDNQVTVVWAPSSSDVNCTEGRNGPGGDPFAQIALDPNSPLFNPNYRRCDVEGYRIYRATGLSGGFERIAQFDKTGTFLSDVACELDPSFVPEENKACAAHDVELTGDVIQFREGGRVRNAVTQSVQILPQGADTVKLEDTGVPFAFIDNSVRNGITYRYIVTAFDVNSLKSGSSSLESPRQPQFVTPRKDPNNLVLASFTSTLTGDNTTALNPDAPHPTINSATGVFSGPQPPTNGITSTFAPLVARLLPAFTLTATIDSVVAKPEEQGCPKGENGQGMCWRAFVSYVRGTTTTRSIVEGFNPIWANFGDPTQVEWVLGGAAVPADPAGATQFGLPSTFPGFNAALAATINENIFYSAMEGQYNRRFGACNSAAGSQADACTTRVHGGSRWFNGTTETVADPTTWTRHGRLTGIDTISSAMNHTPPVPGSASPAASTAIQSFYYSTSAYARAADVAVTWGANGAITSVRDVTHNVNVPFNQNPRGSWGFLNTDANADGNISFVDFNLLDTPKALCAHNNFCLPSVTGAEATTARLENTAKLGNISYSTATAPATSGTGFAMYINGEKYFFQTAALPASGTVWTLRTYAGQIRTAPSLAQLDANGYTFTPLAHRPAFVTGLKVNFAATQASQLVGEADLSQVHTVPDPYYVRSAFELGPSNKVLRFVNLPTQAVIRIYTLNGTLVRVIEHNDALGGAEESWDLRNRNNQFVASGVYFYVVEGAGGKRHTGKFTVVQFAR